MGHAWNIYVYGASEGEVNGAFRMTVEGTDASGSVLSSNTSNAKTFTSNWGSQTMRMRPHPDATEMTIRVSLDIDSTSTVGSLFIDSFVLRAIRPHMDWVNGSIADTAVSTGGRSFNWGTSYGQSLIADLLEDGASGVKGYVYEPYLTAVGLPSTFLPTYASGYNLAESHAAANRYASWMGVVVGDPKMAPYTDVLHDINIVDVRTVGDVNQGEVVNVEVLVENLGMATSNGTLEIRTVLGNTILNQSLLTLPAGDTAGSRTTVNLTMVPATDGLLDLRIRYTNASPERNFGNNLLAFSVVVNAPPSIEDVYCSAALLSRGEYTICSVEATDDRDVVNATLGWQILGENQSINESGWTVLFMGKISPTVWETALVIPANASLGAVALRATVSDNNSMRPSWWWRTSRKWWTHHRRGSGRTLLAWTPPIGTTLRCSRTAPGGLVPSSDQSTHGLRNGHRLRPYHAFARVLFLSGNAWKRQLCASVGGQPLLVTPPTSVSRLEVNLAMLTLKYAPVQVPCSSSAR